MYLPSRALSLSDAALSEPAKSIKLYLESAWADIWCSDTHQNRHLDAPTTDGL